ncbi:DUF6527 family protein [Salinibacterium sp.]|uniref:DUF6527 family protein n=1 Tax=Salinibacterium sp. TaxID=1915057 RepID=UPI00286C515A|nr:DUF6527 family protein [Salinibacterium sp.]
MTVKVFRAEFVEFVPPDREEGVLYISTTYRTAVHSCACGCGLKVVTPIRPSGWHLLWDGDSASLTPSIGNWGFPCRSHYFIRGGRVHWARQWSSAQVSSGAARDRADRDREFVANARTTPSKAVGWIERLFGGSK